MFSILTKCCSSSSSCPFQNALNNCTYADWNVPSQKDMLYALQCFQGKYKGVVQSQKAFAVFKAKFEKHQDKNNSAFRLKNLLLLDRCTEEKCILDLIANYEYNRLFYERNKVQPSVQNKSVQQFICSYYLYLKKKAGIYQRFPDELFNHKTRKNYLSNANNLGRIFEFIDNSLQIQKLLNQTNETLKTANKSPPLMQQILTYMLKTYIFFYTVVSICLQALLGKIKLLKFSQLNNLERLLKYFSRDYSNAFLSFLQANKTIPAFKNIQYNQIIKIDQTYMNIFDKYYKIKASEAGSSAEGLTSQKALNVVDTPTTAKSIIDSQELQNTVLELPDQVFQKLTQLLTLSYQPRKPIQEIPSSDAHIYQMSFAQYQNHYSEDFIRQNKIQVSRDIPAKHNTTSTNKTKASRVKKKKSIMEDLINSNVLRKSSIKDNLTTKGFKQVIWITWQNIYCEQQ